MNDRRPVDDDMDALRVLIREAHEAMKDLKATIKDAEKARIDLMGMVVHIVDSGIKETVQAGLDAYAVQIKQAIDLATDAVYDRFDVVAATLLGETEQQKRKGEPTLLDQAKLVRRVIEGVDPSELTDEERGQVDLIQKNRERRNQ